MLYSAISWPNLCMSLSTICLNIDLGPGHLVQGVPPPAQLLGVKSVFAALIFGRPTLKGRKKPESGRFGEFGSRCGFYEMLCSMFFCTPCFDKFQPKLLSILFVFIIILHILSAGTFHLLPLLDSVLVGGRLQVQCLVVV